MDIKSSFLAPMSLPWKLLQNKEAVSGDIIKPVHIKLYPTDKCNAACPCCACRNMKRDQELKTEEMLDIVKYFHSLGTRAITLGGGGEPSLHPGLPQLFELCKELDIQLGIITNGLLWSKKRGLLPANDHLVWARMSIVDTESGNYDISRVQNFASNLPDVAVSAYFTVTSNMSFKTAINLAEAIEKIESFTHIKFVEDVVSGASSQMDELEKLLSSQYSKVILQRWEAADRGAKICHISRLRPTVAADGYVYPCCSVPHAQELDSLALTLPPEFRMCHWEDFSIDGSAFDGSRCVRCPWGEYNRVLAGLTGPILHERFI